MTFESSMTEHEYIAKLEERLNKIEYFASTYQQFVNELEVDTSDYSLWLAHKIAVEGLPYDG